MPLAPYTARSAETHADTHGYTSVSTLQVPSDPYDYDLQFLPAISAPKLLAAMQSAAVYAELASVTGSWEPNEIERRLYKRDWNKPGPARLRGTFYGARNGGNIHAARAEAVRSLAPDSNLDWWRRHPLGLILCDASLGQDGVLDALRMLPQGPERSCIWDERWVSTLTATTIAREIQDSSEVIQRLAVMRTPSALLAVVGRMRLNQLRAANGFLDVDYEKALLHMLPETIAHSPHLFLGQDALLEAVWLFLRWIPHAESRFLLRPDSHTTAREVDDRLAEATGLINWPGLPRPPADQLKLRRAKVVKIMRDLG